MLAIMCAGSLNTLNLPLWNFSSIGGTIFLALKRRSLVERDIFGDSFDIGYIILGSRMKQERYRLTRPEVQKKMLLLLMHYLVE